ncbi:long-chain-fatty-acid--CoA ligase [Caenimonas soli]|uniref:long-chain-fatty-acid--CoA ligase n=1 Tax=Caenimonas soli TaxID=2735555 RepID=UPI0015567BA3|nr:long-chain-fatty-acid--CoA ligase [Caenimonas soli]NPC58182.1 AMP-binding protein [Caenimonas soli]
MTARQGALHFRQWPKGVAKGLVVPRATLVEYLETAAKHYPDKPAIVYAGATTTYSRLMARVDALAAFLQRQLNVRPGDRVLIASQNCPQFVMAYYAILRAQAVVVTINPMSKASEMRYYAADSGARVAFVAQDLLQEAPLDLLDGVIVHAYSEAIALKDDQPDWVVEPRRPHTGPKLHFFEEIAATEGVPTGEPRHEDFAVMLYTSGTTGQPKGCMLAHSNLVAAIASSVVWKGLHAESVFLTVAPLFHIMGMQNTMNIPVLLGATAVMMPRWNAQAAARLIEEHRVSTWTAAPAMVLDLFSAPEASARDLSSLTFLGGGGAAMPEPVAAMLAKRYGLTFVESYGLSETASFLHCNPIGRTKRQCLGIPAQGVDSRIVDPETLEELPVGAVGELITHGAQVMLGYWNKPEANAESFVEIEGKRFFRTGDLAAMDEEGYFFMRDRLKRMINAAGYKVWPAEVESTMYAHPAIHEACVIAVPDAKRGETVKALVVLKPAYRGQVTEQQIIDWSRERMAAYKAPRIVEFVEQLPRSGTGKIQWRELQEQHRQASAAMGTS